MSRSKNRLSSFFVLKLILLIFGILGIVFSAVSIGITINTQSFLQKAVPVEATIVSIGSSRNRHTVFVAYTIDGVAYEESLGFYSSSMRKGQILNAYVDPDNPRDVRVQAAVLPLVFGIVGGVFLLTTVVILFVILARKRRKQALLRDGRVVHAQVDRVFLNTHISMNGRNPYQISCHYVDPETGMQHEFKSEYLWFDPSPYLTNSTLPVYVPSNHFNRHFVDTRAIQERHAGPSLP